MRVEAFDISNLGYFSCQNYCHRMKRYKDYVISYNWDTTIIVFKKKGYAEPKKYSKSRQMIPTFFRDTLYTIKPKQI